MCGITGLFVPGGAPEEALRGTVAAMTDALAHRGPDGHGLWCDPGSGIALGHRRLAIIDLTQQGHQPMVSHSGRHVLTFNGEIYNFQDVRRELESEGRQPAWRGRSDTEVALAAIEAWGLAPACKRFAGMFALGLWDRENRRLSLVRDRLGEKPFYYGDVGGRLAFASELKALRTMPGWPGEIDREALTLYLRHGYIPAPFSIYRGIRKVAPGTIVHVTATSAGAWREEVQPFWSLREVVESARARDAGRSEDEALDQLESLLREVIRGQMIADVPVGAFLSGGIDSSVIVALMQAESSRPVRTFTIGFAEAAYDERSGARRVAESIGTEHTDLLVDAREALDVIPLLPRVYDEPFADSSQIPTYIVSRLARPNVTVALSGDGGDELFGGYERYRVCASIWRNSGGLPRSVRGACARALAAVPVRSLNALLRLVPHDARTSLGFAVDGDRLHRFAEILGFKGLEDLYLRLVSHTQNPAALVPGARLPSSMLADPAAWPRLDDPVLRMMAMDGLTYLPDDILVKVDRAAMSAGLETRTPFVDHRVVEFAWGLPLAFRYQDGQSKRILRRLAARHVPAELLVGPKRGFAIPLASWLRTGLREWAEALLDERGLRDDGFLDPVAVRALWRTHLSGEGNRSFELWDILMFQAWLRETRGEGVPVRAASGAMESVR